MALKLTTQTKKQIFGLSHSIKPVVQVGQNFLTENLIKEFNSSIDHHELIKIKMAFEADSSEERTEIREAICNELLKFSPGTTLIKIIGNVAVFYKPSKKKKVEELLRLHRAG